MKVNAANFPSSHVSIALKSEFLCIPRQTTSDITPCSVTTKSVQCLHRTSTSPLSFRHRLASGMRYAYLSHTVTCTLVAITLCYRIAIPAIFVSVKPSKLAFFFFSVQVKILPIDNLFQLIDILRQHVDIRLFTFYVPLCSNYIHVLCSNYVPFYAFQCPIPCLGVPQDVKCA